MTEYTISLIPGDGIGPELTEATLKVLDAVQKKFGVKLKMVEAEAGDMHLSKTWHSPTSRQRGKNQSITRLPKRTSRRNSSRRHSETAINV